MQYKNSTFIFILVLLISTTCQAQFEYKETCHTDMLDENKRSLDIEGLKYQDLRNITWSLNSSYGVNCTNPCTMPSSATCTDPNKSKYPVPVVFTISQTVCTQTQPTQQNIADQIAQLNAYYACQGLPFYFYLATQYTNHPTSGDMSTRYLDLGCTINQNTSLPDIPNVLNIYVYSATEFGSFCNGWAVLPTSASSLSRIVISHNCLNSLAFSNINCLNPNLGIGIVLIHEVGHIFGLYHTHNELNTSQTCPDNSNQCDSGDFVEDTDADPGLHLSCSTHTGCTVDPSNCTSPCNTPYPSQINTESNIMSYNNFIDCRNNFTPCQKTRMMDAYTNVRGLQWCDRNINNDISGGMANATKIWCAGQPLPSFEATSDCFKWYDGLGPNANLLYTGQTFTPSLGVGLGLLDTNTPGVYTWYIGDINELNPYCRSEISITVFDDFGTASINNLPFFIPNTCDQNETITLSLDNTIVPDDHIVGWWITESQPIQQSIVDQNSLENALINVHINTPLSNPVNHLMMAAEGSTLHQIGMSINCSTLDKEKMYFATPIISQYIADVPSSQCLGMPTGQMPIIINGSNGFYNSIPPNNIQCVPTNPPSPTYTFTVEISNYTGPQNGILFLIYSNGVLQGSNLFASFNFPGNGTYTFDQDDFAGYDPGNPLLTAGLTVIAAGNQNSGMTNANLSISLDIIYPGTEGIPFPTIPIFSSCLFGQETSLHCPCDCLPVALITSNDPDLYGCKSNNIELTANPTGAYTYLWQNAQNQQTITVTPTTSTQYSVTVSHAEIPCSSADSIIYIVETDTVSNSAENGLHSLRHVYYCIEDDDTLYFNIPNLEFITLLDTILFDKNITCLNLMTNDTLLYADLTQGQLSMRTSLITIAPNVTTHLENINVKVNSDTSSPSVLLNKGQLDLNNCLIQSNHNNFIINEGNLILTNQNQIKKE